MVCSYGLLGRYCIVLISVTFAAGLDSIVHIDDRDPHIKFTGTWTHLTNDFAFNTTVIGAASPSATISYKFTGLFILPLLPQHKGLTFDQVSRFLPLGTRVTRKTRKP